MLGFLVLVKDDQGTFAQALVLEMHARDYPLAQSVKEGRQQLSPKQ